MKTENSSKPGDDFNDRGDLLALLTAHGAQYLYSRGDTDYIRRPGKPTGALSATLNYSGCGGMYVFTSNWPPFKPNEFYSKFAVFALLECSGDFSEAAKKLSAQGYGGGEAAPRTKQVKAPTPGISPGGERPAHQGRRALQGRREAATYDDAEERIILCMINRKVKDKTTDYETLNARFDPFTGTPRELAAELAKGYAMTNSFFEGRRTDGNFTCSELLVYDVDNGTKAGRYTDGRYWPLSEALEHNFLKKHCTLIYTTPNYTEDFEKFRLIIPLPFVLYDPKDYAAIRADIRKDVNFPNDDEATKAASQIFYGSSQGQFWLNNGGHFTLLSQVKQEPAQKRGARPIAPAVESSIAPAIESPIAPPAIAPAIAELLEYFAPRREYPFSVRFPDGSYVLDVPAFVARMLRGMVGKTDVPPALHADMSRLSELRRMCDRSPSFREVI